MDEAALLDILGNENRRNILKLLSLRPFYVTEISERLHVAPKAVISHLSMLEQAGIIAFIVDERRRKYSTSPITCCLRFKSLRSAMALRPANPGQRDKALLRSQLR